ncbi:MAG: GNAT family protein [Methylophilus sp.]|jgi:hypothetical protein
MFVFDAERVGKWVVEKSGGAYTHVCTAIGYEVDGVLVGGIMYDGFTGEKGKDGGQICMSSRVDDAKKLPREFYWVIFDYPFNQLKVKAVRVIVNKNNLKAQKVNEHIGFKREAVLGDYFPEGDAIIYVLNRSDCRFLGDKYVRFSQTARASR